MSEAEVNVQKVGAFERFIRGVEVVGNKCPHPFWLFVFLSLLIMFVSAWLSGKGVSVTYMAAGRGGAAPAQTTVAVVNLLSYDSIRVLLSDFVKTYMNFAPLGLVLVMMLGIGLVEQVGMISALMRKTILGAPRSIITAVIALVGINANLASDAGIIFTPVIAAAVFKSLGRNPWVGIAVGYAAATGGFTANFFVAGTDALLAGITKSAIEGVAVIPPDTPAHPLINWYFMIAATFVLTFVTVIVTEKYTVKMLGDESQGLDPEELKKHAVTPAENRGLLWSLLTLIGYIGLILALTIPEGSLFRSPDGSLLPKSPLMSSIVSILFFMFFFVGIAYGLGAGVIKGGEDVPKLMQKGIVGSVGFMVVVLPASIFVELFRASSLDTVLSVVGADWLKAMNIGGVALIIVFILLVTFLDLFMSSGSAKWLIMAPIFVPMFAHVGFSPALTQCAYRVGDSCANIITPISYYLPIIIGLLEQYKKDANTKVGLGTVISLGLPFSIFYLIGFVALLIIWYVFGLPLGPGVPCTL